MARRRYQDGGGSIGFGGLFGASFGYIGTSIYFVLGGLGLYALGVTPLLILVVGLVFVGDRLVLRRRLGGDARGERRDQLRPARLQPARRVRRRLGLAARQHHPRRHRLLVRPRLPQRVLASAAGLALRLPDRARRVLLVIVDAQRPRRARVGAPRLVHGAPRAGHSRAPRDRRVPGGRPARRAVEPDRLRRRSVVGHAPVRGPARRGGVPRHRRRLQPRRQGAAPGPGRPPRDQRGAAAHRRPGRRPRRRGPVLPAR